MPRLIFLLCTIASIFVGAVGAALYVFIAAGVHGWQQDIADNARLRAEVATLREQGLPMMLPIQDVEMKQMPEKHWVCKPRRNCKITWEKTNDTNNRRP